MNLIFRLLITIVHSFFRKRLHPLSESVLHLRVLPNDLDLNLHMNNGRFLTIMDLGRLDLLLRTDLAKEMVVRKWQPLVGAVQIRYRQSLMPFQRYRLHTRVVGWDDKWFYIEQRFERKNRLIAVGRIQALFRAPGRNVPPEEAFQLIQVNLDRHHPPEDWAKGFF